MMNDLSAIQAEMLDVSTDNAQITRHLMPLMAELRAAREVVRALKKALAEEYCLACDYGHEASKALKTYDETRRG